MDLHTRLQDELKKSSKEQIVKKLGYNSTSKARQALDTFIKCKNLHGWISYGFYDFKYTSVEFVKRLGEILSVSSEDIQVALDRQKVYQKELKRVQSSYIFVQTNFVRAGESIFVLACLSSTRRLALPTEKLLFKTDKEIFEIVSKLIVEHYKRTEGKLLIFGKIDHYQYHHTDNKIYTFGGDGEEIDCEVTQESNATLYVGGKKLW